VNKPHKVQVFVTPHALLRIEQRGGDPGVIAAAARRAGRRVAPRLRHSCRLALDVAHVPEVIPVVEFRPARRGKPVQAVVKTVLPCDASPSLEVVYV